MSEELKRCPFCGETMTMRQSINSFQSGLVRWINCENCFAHSPMCTLDDLSDDEYEAWNTRPIEDELNARITQLTAERDELKNELENERDSRKNELGNGLLTTLVNGNALAVRHLKQELAELQLENELLKGKTDRLASLLHDEMSQLNIATDLADTRWRALNEIYTNGEKHNANWCKRKAQEGLGIKNG